MTSHLPGCCASCGTNIPFKSILIAPIVSGRRWSVDCPHCGNRNYMHVLADYVICFAILLLAFFLVGKIAGGTDTPNEKSTELLGYGAALLLYVPLRGAMNYLYLRVGKFHKNWI